VEIIRNTPLLVQLFIIYFSLPGLGIRLEAEEAAVLGLSLNLGGYATEILRAGLDAIPKGQIEAGRALGLTRLQIFRLIMLFPALRIVYPALASQFVILLLGSSIVSAISAPELTGVTNTLQSTTFRAFEFYFVATGLYLLMAIAVRLALDGIQWLVFVRGRAW
jgi:polar amino acid transport system permease protein